MAKVGQLDDDDRADSNQQNRHQPEGAAAPRQGGKHD
jgi:hypothetical protein